MRRRFFGEVAGPILIIMGLLTVWLFFNYAGTSLPGSEWSEVSANILTLWPYFVVFGIGVAVVFTVGGNKRWSTKSVFYIPAMATVGIVLSLIISTLTDLSVIELAGITMSSLATIIIVACVLVGIAMGVVAD